MRTKTKRNKFCGVAAALCVLVATANAQSPNSKFDESAVVALLKARRDSLSNVRLEYTNNVQELQPAFGILGKPALPGELPTSNLELISALRGGLCDQVLFPEGVVANISTKCQYNAGSFIQHSRDAAKDLEYTFASNSRIYFCLQHKQKVVSLDARPRGLGANYLSLITGYRKNSAESVLPPKIPLWMWLSEVVSNGQAEVTMRQDGEFSSIQVREPFTFKGQQQRFFKKSLLTIDRDGNLRSLSCSLADGTRDAIEFYNMKCSDFRKVGTNSLPFAIEISELCEVALSSEEADNLAPGKSHEGEAYRLMVRRRLQNISVQNADLGTVGNDLLNSFEIPSGFSLRDKLTQKVTVTTDAHRPFSKAK